jgi:REP element-mobilizing transposase RayT
VSRLRRLVLSDRYFFVTCNLRPRRNRLNETDFECLAAVIIARREIHGFCLTAWVFMPDHWHAIIYPRHPLTISRVMESIKVSSTSLLNTGRKELGQIWQPRFFDRALRTVKEYWAKVEYIHQNPVRRGLVPMAEDWAWSSVHEYGPLPHRKDIPTALRIDRVNLPADSRTRI